MVTVTELEQSPIVGNHYHDGPLLDRCHKFLMADNLS